MLRVRRYLMDDGKLIRLPKNLYATEETDGLPRKPLWFLRIWKPDGISTIQSGETVLISAPVVGSTYSSRLAEWPHRKSLAMGWI